MTTNFLFIIVDDLNSWIGALGRHPQAQTPNIDALARRGALFVNAYCSAPYCNASRMGIFTGRWPSTLGVYDNQPFWDAPKRPVTLMERLRQSGYHTVGAGKVFHGAFDYAKAGFERLDHAPWQEVENRDLAWDEFHPNTHEPLPYRRPLNGLFDFGEFGAVPDKYRHFDWGPCEASQEDDLPDAQVVASVRAFLSRPKAPFFCAAGLYKPHLPWHAPKRFFDAIPESVALPLVKDDDLDDAPPTAREWALDPKDHELITHRGVWRDAVRAYLACISYADFMVGELVKALDESQHRNDTTIVLCGDNGFHLGEKLHWRKFALWEEATRVPLIVVPAGGRHGPARVLEPASLIDIYPTILKAAGVDPGPGIDGEDLLARVGGAALRTRPVLSTWGEGNHSLRSARWRYTIYRAGGAELFDHACDPYEWTNLADDPAYADVCRAMSQSIHAEVAIGKMAD
ncbi:MAG: sulfatase [Hyphomonadaceae bacterium]